MTTEEKLDLIAEVTRADKVSVSRQFNLPYRDYREEPLPRPELPKGAVYYMTHTEGTYEHAVGYGTTIAEAVDDAVVDAKKHVMKNVEGCERAVFNAQDNRAALVRLLERFPKER